MGQDLIIGLALVLVLEGLMYSLFPGVARKMALEVTSLPEGTLRAVGVVAMFIGVIIVWFVRG